MFRTAQEAIRNVGSHAAAEHVRIGVAQTNGLVTLRVADDGRGVDADELTGGGARATWAWHMLRDLAETAGGAAAGDVGAGDGTTRRARGAGAVIRVVVIDDHAIVRDGLVQLMRSHPDLEVVGAAGDGDGGGCALRRAASRRRADGPLDAGNGRRRGDAPDRRHAPGVQVVVLTSFMDRDRIVDALGRRRDRLPAEGRRARRADPRHPRRRARRVAARPSRGAHDAGAQRTPRPLDALTEREREVLALVAEGLPNKQIARRLEISEKTVKAHLTSVFRDDRRRRPHAGRPVGAAKRALALVRLAGAAGGDARRLVRHLRVDRRPGSIHQAGRHVAAVHLHQRLQ